jgi:hypothetical protein
MSRRNSHTVRTRQQTTPRANVAARRGGTAGKRARGAGGKERVHYMPPENWHEPRAVQGWKIIRQSAGVGYRHVLSAADVRERLHALPKWMTQDLQVVQISRMTRKKSTFPCYGMQWGNAIYLYPVEDDRIEHFLTAPKPAQLIEARMFGATWQQTDDAWQLHWTESALRDFYLNNVLIHELGHLLDQRNSNYADRERYAEWFAIEYGYKPSRQSLAQAAADLFCPAE